MHDTEHVLGNTTVRQFLLDTWQQKPLLIRAALPGYQCPISADEMAGLACDPDIESRIILERDGDYAWQCMHGPFDENLFANLPATHWTLLLQSCNLHLPVFAQLMERFNFIPNWRVDDVMMSYAPPSGSVGPHTDNYDVFLLQAQGTREWQISTRKFRDDEFLSGLDLKILKAFEAEHTWTLEPGDMLYLPPGVAHHGIALDDCITISIGFRAPNYAELSEAILDHLVSKQGPVLERLFYQDPKLPYQKDRGEITTLAMQQINDIMTREILPRLQNHDWFGEFVTQPGSMGPIAPLESLSYQRCLQLLEAGQRLVREESSKLAFYQSDDKQVHFYCNGNTTYYPMELRALIAIICNQRYPCVASMLEILEDAAMDKIIREQAQALISKLINQGHLVFNDGND